MVFCTDDVKQRHLDRKTHLLGVVSDPHWPERRLELGAEVCIAHRRVQRQKPDATRANQRTNVCSMS